MPSHATLSGEQLQRVARETAAALADVDHGRPFTPHLGPGRGVTKRLVEDLVHHSCDLVAEHGKKS
ncbi:hypothetical protein [Nocardia sp. GTS18]|uniref:hypothetical protein n=1 Tax=unclassified Nocardia TaxID=2637762 RepID=UPI0015EF542F|nr:hypothetical protein [Nocardia sp. GTS18]